MDDRYSAVLIDDDPLRRASLRLFLDAAGIDITAESSHGISAIPAVASASPSFVFLSFEEPLPRAIHTVEAIVDAAPDTLVVAFSDEATNGAYQRAIRAGARYLIDTPASERETKAVIDSIRPHAAPPIRTSGSIVTVAGPKGGIGKTTISVNIASALAHGNKGTVLLIDLDPDFGDAGILLDLNTNYSTARAARDQSQFEFDSFKRILSVHESGAYLLGAPQRFGERLGTTPADLSALIAFAAKAFDYVILDTPCTLDDLVITAFNSADVTLLATTLEFASLRNAALLQENIIYEGTPRERTVIVANHTDPLAGFSPGDAAEVLERQSIWEVPYDPAMPRSTQEGRPLTLIRPKSAASMSLTALAGRLGEAPERIDRRLAVRGPGLAPAEVRARLFSVVRSARPRPAVQYLVSTARRAATYHLDQCSIAMRLASPMRVSQDELHSDLRPCRVCQPDAATVAA